MAKKKSQVPDVIVEEVYVKQLALLAVTGASVRTMAEQSGLSDYQVKKIIERQDFKDTVREVVDSTMERAKTELRHELSRMTKECTRVLYANLQENQLEAVKLIFKALGIAEEEKRSGDTSIVVQLPGDVGGTIIEAEKAE